MSAEEFGLRLHGLITRKYKTVKDFAKAANLPYSSVEGYVNGHHEPSLGKLVVMMGTLGCTWDELLGKRCAHAQGMGAYTTKEEGRD